MEKNNEKRLPPYVSYRTFRNFLDYLKEGMPERIDRSYWGDKLSGSRGIQLMTALRFLHLLDDSNHPTEMLDKLVHSEGDERREILSHIAYETYGFVFEGLDIKRATPAQLAEKFKDINPDVARKCIAFFISLASDADIALSSFIRKKKRMIKAGAKPRKRVKKKEPSQSLPPSTEVPTFPSINGIPLDVIGYVAKLPEEEQDKFIKVYLKFKKAQKEEK